MKNKKLNFSGVCLICGNDEAREEHVIPGLGYTCDYCSKLGTNHVINMIRVDGVAFRTRLMSSVGHGRFDKLVSKLNGWVSKRERKTKE